MNIVDYDNVESEFELKLNFHFRTYVVVKGMNFLIPTVVS